MQQLETTVVHAGEPNPRIEGSVVTPIFQSAMYQYADSNDETPVRYIRYNNTPNHTVLHKKLAALEQTEAALVTGSGMAAISAALLSVLSSDDHLLIQPGLYGGTQSFLTEILQPLDVTFDVLPEDPDAWESVLRPNTKAIYAESITNPLMRVADLEALSAFGREFELTSLIDNTFATPYNFRPADHGFDIVLHSASKYLNGHSDIVAGTVMGSAERVFAIETKLRHLGGSLDPHAAYLLNRGLKTLALRVQQQNATALKLATFLTEHALVTTVNYPGLPDHPGHSNAEKLLDGFGGMLSLELHGGVSRARRLMEELQLPISAPSLGGVESLITRPVTTSHRSIPREKRMEMGITDRLIRVSVGIENADDLVEDFRTALQTLDG
jgi:cystathionine beta-lyase/cystathionine gamma-synthase